MHLDLSGIPDLRKPKLIELVNELVDFNLCVNLMCIHMNDLGLNTPSQNREDINELFRIQS